MGVVGAGDDGFLVALPLEHVRETMRPLPVRALPGLPRFVPGLAMVRGQATPVVDAGALLGVRSPRAGRFVSLDVGSRTVALAVTEVLGVRDLDGLAPHLGADGLPPLLRTLDNSVVEAVRAVDSDLLLVLTASALVPEETWAAVSSAPAGAAS
ncbi:chemotaxis protein CheW [Spongisporangium articulatum]|uniref:Chemotaxis protein CheW n=1 Tax=Spongisporangium articulatum TaxID=3362603 RepID=A0ABW8ALM7_9ACTN